MGKYDDKTVKKETTGEEIAQKIVDDTMSYVNKLGFNPELIVNEVLNAHRTLQQCFGKIVFLLISKWAEQYRDGRYDARNQRLVELSHKIDVYLIENDVMGKEYYKFPFI